MFQRRLIKERNVRKKKKKKGAIRCIKNYGTIESVSKHEASSLRKRKEDGQIEREREEEEGIALFFERDRTGVVIV